MVLFFFYLNCKKCPQQWQHIWLSSLQFEALSNFSSWSHEHYRLHIFLFVFIDGLPTNFRGACCYLHGWYCVLVNIEPLLVEYPLSTNGAKCVFMERFILSSCRDSVFNQLVLYQGGCLLSRGIGLWPSQWRTIVLNATITFLPFYTVFICTVTTQPILCIVGLTVDQSDEVAAGSAVHTTGKWEWHSSRGKSGVRRPCQQL